MKTAFEAAWASLQASGSVDTAPYRPGWARETLALRIIDTVQSGELDAERLCEDALKHLANSKMEKKA